MLILFFDTYITAGVGDKGGVYNGELMISSLGGIRDNLHSYRWQQKIDVVKYTLASYAPVKWDKVIIRFECEDKNQTADFFSYCKELFPTADISKERSDTALKYSNALSAINESDDAWIFFSPNNDHPYLAEPDDLIRYVSIADKISEHFPKNTIGLVFSHFTECMVANRMTDPQWGYYAFVFKKVIYEDAEIVVIRSNKAPLDSCQIFKLGYLKNIFSATKNTGRVIRLEDTEFNLSLDHNVIQVYPKIELCRHYDSYAHIMDYIPPLFIPNGFFEKNIRIRYGHDDAIKGWVNINPLKKSISSEVDLLNLSDDVPRFWRDRISVFDINPLFPKDLKRDHLAYYNNIRNPWRDRYIFYNLARSCYIFLVLQGWAQGWAVIRRSIREVLIKLGLFELVRSLKRRI